MAEGGFEEFEQLEGIGKGITVWDENTFDEKLLEAKRGGVFKGKDFIYPLWRTLLNGWFADKNSKVYLVSPFVDKQRIEDVCRIILKNDAEDRLVLFYARNEEKAGRRISDTLDSVSERILQDDKTLEDRLDCITEKIKDPFLDISPREYFHAKFIGCVRGTRAEVFIMSANFQAYHFDYNNRDTVCYLEMSEEEFIQRFIQPLKWC